MFRKPIFTILATAALVISIASMASAQVGELHGHVLMQQADGTKLPLADARLRYTAMTSSKYKTKTNKRELPLPESLIRAPTVAAIHPRPTQRGNQALSRPRSRYRVDGTAGGGKRLTLKR